VQRLLCEGLGLGSGCACVSSSGSSSGSGSGSGSGSDSEGLGVVVDVAVVGLALDGSFVTVDGDGACPSAPLNRTSAQFVKTSLQHSRLPMVASQLSAELL